MLAVLRFAVALAAACSATAFAAQASISANQIVELAGQGRYDELAARLGNGALKLNPGEQHALCYAYARTKQYRPLFACLDRLEVQLRGSDRSSILFGLDDATPTLHLMRGEAELDLGLVQQAGEQAQKALDWYAKEGSAAERDIQIDALAASALALSRAQDPGRALEVVQKIEAIKAGFAAGPNVASTRTFALARVYLALGQYDKACAALEADTGFSFRKSVETLLHGNPPNWVWQELPRNFMFARCRFGQGRLDEAKARYDDLLRLPALRQNTGILWMTLYDRGRIAEQEGDAERAIRFYREAIDIIELLRSSIDTEAAKIGFVGDKQGVYGHLVANLLAAKRPAEALEYVERAKGRALVDLLADRYAFPGVRRLDRGDAQAGALLDQHRAAEDALLAQVPGRSENTLQQQRTGLATALENVRKAQPELASLIAVSPASAAELTRLLDSDEVGIQYYLFSDQLFALVFSARGTRGYTLDGTGLTAAIREFRSAIMRRDAQVQVLARKLYDRLVAPLEDAIGDRPLLIVPHGGLHYLPFAALYDGQRYLIERHAVRLTPSASTLKFLRKPAGTRAGALILGNPTLDLPSAEQEAKDLGRIVPDAQVLLGTHATKRALLGAGTRFGTLHIAAHGVFDAARPLESRLLLAADGDTTGDLRVSVLYALSLSERLVTLSACETGLGRVTDGGDVIGMTRGFLYAGASGVVASLWQVADEATLVLMQRFYVNLATMNRRDALRAAQREVAKKIPQPYFWAAFYLTGSTS